MVGRNTLEVVLTLNERQDKKITYCDCGFYITILRRSKKNRPGKQETSTRNFKFKSSSKYYGLILLILNFKYVL